MIKILLSYSVCTVFATRFSRYTHYLSETQKNGISQYFKVLQCNISLCFKEDIGKEIESRSQTVKQNKTATLGSQTSRKFQRNSELQKIALSVLTRHADKSPVTGLR